MTDPKEQAAIDCREIFEKHKEEFTRLVTENVRINSAPARCDELETVERQYNDNGFWKITRIWNVQENKGFQIRELVTRQNAEEVIAAKDARIAELEEHFAEMTRSCLAERDRNKALEADNKRLREALEPFAKTALGYDDPDENGPWPDIQDVFVTLGDCRRARAALGEAGHDL